MNLKLRKTILEVYGLLRLTLGAAELVGLCAAYFFLEFVLRYPSQAVLYVIDEDMVALIYLAIVLRGLFHIFVGIGVAQLKNWGRGWIIWGWPIISMVNIGVVWIIYQHWQQEGYVSNFFQIIAWFKLLLYIGFMLFDLLVIAPSIKVVDENASIVLDYGGFIGGKKIAGILFVIIACFVALLFLGQPVKKGFHKGFYKARGVSVKVVQERADEALPQFQPETVRKENKKSDLPDYQVVKANKEKDIASQEVVDETREKVNKNLDETKTSNDDQDRMPFRRLIGWVGALAIVIAFFSQAYTFYFSRENSSGLTLSYALLGFGFLLWAIYGITLKLFPVIIVSIVVSLMCLLIILRLADEK